ncbi:NF-kappa-B inhibitor alpha-like [Ruditapes philippinarum]|uniref:NF-kappa-B inhibitor alpha-like n=1 Tax=Ruditapes philippinarum TaxID=129788 RepID=UPI00295B1118|nr:NF-kappa-B inhibitor alpha-like [Ruditapes philippinarum]
MTMMNEDEVPNITYSDASIHVIPQNRFLPDVVHCTMNMDSFNQVNHISDHGRCVMTETTDYGTKQYPDIASVFSEVNKKMSYRESQKNINDLCEQLDSVEMIDDCSVKRFNELESFEGNHGGHMAANIDASRIYLRDKDGDTLLHIAIILRDDKLAMIFIGKAPSNTWLSFTNVLFQTPLHLSVLTDQPEVTRRLIVAGAEVDKRDKDGNTALHIACRQGQHKNVQNLLEPVRYHEIKHNSYDIPYQTIPQDLSIKNYEGLTCLHLAASNGHLDIVSMLLDKDIDVNLKEGKTGRTILHNACLTGDLNIVKLLLRHRSCNINARTFDGSTPFDLARIRGHEDICLILAAAGAGYGEDLTDSD